MTNSEFPLNPITLKGSPVEMYMSSFNAKTAAKMPLDSGDECTCVFLGTSFLFVV